MPQRYGVYRIRNFRLGKVNYARPWIFLRERPELAPDKAKSELVTIRVTPVELYDYKRESERNGLDLSDWIRNVLQKSLKTTDQGV